MLSTYHYHYLLSVQSYCVATTYVTGFEKSWLPHTHKSITHFHHQTIAVHINQQFSQVLMLKVAQAAFAVACF